MVRISILIVGIAAFTSGCTDSAFKSYCRADLEGSLKSSSSLQIVDSVSVTTDMDVLEARTRYVLPKKLHLERMKGGKLVVPIHEVSITYDADNSYGAALRGYHNCTMIDYEYGLTSVKPNVTKDPTVYQPSIDEMIEQSKAEVDAASKALESAKDMARKAAEAAR